MTTHTGPTACSKAARRRAGSFGVSRLRSGRSWPAAVGHQLTANLTGRTTGSDWNLAFAIGSIVCVWRLCVSWLCKSTTSGVVDHRD